MSFWGNWSWLYFIGVAIIAIGIIGCNVFKYKPGWRLIDFFSSFIAIGVVASLICLLTFLINLFDYHDQKKLYESEYSCIVNFNEKIKNL